MQKCIELSQLRKPSNGLKSIKFKRTTPGSIASIVYANKPPPSNRVLDSTHPALLFSPTQFAKAFPWRTFPGFALRAVPKGLLDKPLNPFPDPPFMFAPVPRIGAKAREDGRGRVSMSLMDVARRNAGGRVLRVNVFNKLKTAIALVVTRGADVEEGKDGQRIVFRDERLGGDWVLSDWTYMCRPDPQMYRMPYPTLVSSLRRALSDMFVRGKQLEEQWCTEHARQVSSIHAPPRAFRAEKKAAKESKQPAEFPDRQLDPPSSSATEARSSRASSMRPRTSSPPQLLAPSISQASPSLNAFMQRFKDQLSSRTRTPSTRKGFSSHTVA